MATLGKIVKSSLFKDFLKVLVAFLSGYASSGCAALPHSPALARLDCQVAAFEAVVPRSVAEDLVMAARVGNFDYVVAQLRALEVSVDQVREVAKAFDACRADAEPAVDAPVEVPELLGT